MFLLSLVMFMVLSTVSFMISVLFMSELSLVKSIALKGAKQNMVIIKTQHNFKITLFI